MSETRAPNEDLTPRPYYDLARQLVGEFTPEAELRIAHATAEVLDILSALNALAARVERLRASGQHHQRVPSRDIPEDIPKWQPGESFNMPGPLGGEFFETDPEAFFWSELDLRGLREQLADGAARLTRELQDADTPFNAWARAEELLARLPDPIIDALRSRLVELEGEREMSKKKPARSDAKPDKKQQRKAKPDPAPSGPTARGPRAAKERLKAERIQK